MSVIVNDNNLKKFLAIINDELEKKRNTWLRVNKLSLNERKTHYIIFHRAGIKL